MPDRHTGVPGATLWVGGQGLGTGQTRYPFVLLLTRAVWTRYMASKVGLGFLIYQIIFIMLL